MKSDMRVTVTQVHDAMMTHGTTFNQIQVFHSVFLQVHDLYKHDDIERQADCTDWLLRTLLQSRMKIVLVDSPALATLYRALSTLHNGI